MNIEEKRCTPCKTKSKSFSSTFNNYKQCSVSQDHYYVKLKKNILSQKIKLGWFLDRDNKQILLIKINKWEYNVIELATLGTHW